MASNRLKFEFLIFLIFAVHFGTAFDWKGNEIRWATNCSFAGDDNIMTKTPVPGAMCGGECVNTPTCSHFSWSPNQSGTCVLKSSRPTLSSSKEYESKAVNAPVQGSSCGFLNLVWKDDQNWALHCDFVNSKNLSTIPAEGKDCGGLCFDSKEPCTHFTWTSRDGGMCQLKTGKVSKQDANYSPHAVCGIVDRIIDPTSTVNVPTSVASATTPYVLLVTVLFLNGLYVPSVL